MKLGIGGHHRGYQGRTDEWLTPPDIIRALGPFDLDPAAPVDRPWDTAAAHFTVEDDGLAQTWPAGSRIWLNPPYGPETGQWLARLAAHGNGIALIFARTETEMFHRHGWDKADAMLFLAGRIYFYRVDGTRAAANAGAPSVLIAFGPDERRAPADVRHRREVHPAEGSRRLTRPRPRVARGHETTKGT
jgi:hypothetical protein